ncbi:diphthine--ammonia ligase [Nitrosarchaeum sp. AC2]|jgi:ABC transporter with metal-binding/Fe-S-binding domain ATP-binding protein|uniref:diphthine--ammonia ligase n=1 Tax=Nitrosarchaeum sp. AC2 TaxID=2259673 RepID=UPI0015C92574|nr:diphthine--ammonia ligase [Nitrosarchaeum sp. AC2]QLH11810.1 diphthine--ammonia ligase [Nitrosarchaeum sp. AC2]
MKLASLFSGGKDSLYSIFLAKKQGYEVNCLLSIFPKSAESHLLHHPNLQWTKLQSKSMQIPQLIIESNSDETNNEIILLEEVLIQSIAQYGIEGIVHGGIQSQFQKEKFENLCNKLNLESVTPLWNSNPFEYMNELISSNFRFIISSVSSGGLDDSWLGKIITKNDISVLYDLSKKFGFNLNFEGGEAETFVVDCPLFSHSIDIIKSEKIWDGYRGRFEIVDARLNYNA